jgi:hypothetical protein
MRRRHYLFIFLIVSFLSSLGRAQMSCEDTFGRIDRAIHSLAVLRTKLDLAQAQGSSAPQTNSLRSAYAQKETGLVRYLETHDIMTRAELILRLKKAIFENQKPHDVSVQEEQEKNRDEQTKAIQSFAKIDGSRVDFHTVEASSFKRAIRTGTHSFSQREDNTEFDISATLTTQLVWRKVVLAIQKAYPGKSYFFGAVKTPGAYDDLNPNPSRFNADLNPVEQISYNDVKLWLQALNDLAMSDDALIEEVMPGHKSGQVYRLPTSVERRFIVWGRPLQRSSTFKSGPGDEELKLQAWVSTNSEGTTHPVATKAPTIIGEDRIFYDAVGNVSIWVEDFYPDRGVIRSEHSLDGGSYAHNYLTSRIDKSQPADDFRNSTQGFRLVRSAP